jgi:hypothetical protein
MATLPEDECKDSCMGARIHLEGGWCRFDASAGLPAVLGVFSQSSLMTRQGFRERHEMSVRAGSWGSDRVLSSLHRLLSFSRCCQLSSGELQRCYFHEKGISFSTVEFSKGSNLAKEGREQDAL